MAYPVSTSIHLFFDNNYEIGVNEQIKRIINCGFKYLDFNFLDWQLEGEKSPFMGDKWEDWVKGAKETALQNGAVFNQAHAPCPVFAFSTDYELLLNTCKRAIRGCGILGIEQMVFHAIVYPQQMGLDLSWKDANLKFFGELLEDAHKYGVSMDIENMWPTYKLMGADQWNTDVLMDLVNSLDDDNIGVCWDVGHGHMTGNAKNYKMQNRPEFLPYEDQYENITKIGKKLRALHIHDNNGIDDDHILPFNGFINWNDVIRALDDIGYEHSFTFEAHNAVNKMPDELKDDVVRLMHKLGCYLVNLSTNGRVFNN